MKSAARGCMAARQCGQRMAVATRHVAMLLVFALCSVLNAPAARAQTLDEVQVETRQGDTVMRIKFNARVRYLRHAPTTPSDLVQVYFQIVARDEPANQPTVEEAKVSPPDAPGPAFTVSYPFQANQLTRQLKVQFNRKVSVQMRAGAGDRSIEIVVKGGAKLGGATAASPALVAPEGANVKAEPAASAAPAAPAAGAAMEGPAGAAAAATSQPPKSAVDTFAITLQRVPAGDNNSVKPIPRELEKYEVFTSPLPTPPGGYEVDAGYFADEAAADALRQKVLATFPDAVVFNAAQRKQDNLTAAASRPAAPAAAEGGGAAAPADRQTVDGKAEDLLLAAADAVSAKNYAGAIDLLNQVLLLPPNPSSQTAQELLGVAHERAGEADKARAEYTLYLKLFPTGDGADRVRQRIANLGDLPIPPSPSGAPPAAAAPGVAGGAQAGTPGEQAGAVVTPATSGKAAATPAQKNITGSISQFYYGGQTRSTTLLNVPTGVNQTTLSGVTQSSIVTSIDATARYRDGDTDSRMVLRETNSSSLLSGGHGSNLLSAAYIDYKNVATTLSVRAGRQSGASAGSIGLFDGLSVGYSITPRLRLNVSAGQPSDPYTAAHQRFEGFDLQADDVLQNLGLGVYGINQTVDGAVSRRALGLEGRYFTPRYSLYRSSDYDTAFKATNSTMLQGTLTTENQAVFTLLYDHRRVPGLDLGNALIGNSTYTSLAAMLQAIGYAQTQQLAAQVAAVARQTVLSVSKPVSEHWQGSADLRWSDVGPLPAIGDIPAQPGTGSQVSYSLVATGTNLYSSRDTNVFNLTVLTSSALRGTQLAYNNLTGLLANALSLEPSLRFYVENTNTGLHTTRWTPGVRASYRLNPSASLESEAILEFSKTSGPTSDESATNAFYYIGYRYDFR